MLLAWWPADLFLVSDTKECPGGSAGVNRLKLFLFCKVPETGRSRQHGATSLIPRAKGGPELCPLHPSFVCTSSSGPPNQASDLCASLPIYVQRALVQFQVTRTISTDFC